MRTCNRLSVLIVNLIFITTFPDLQAQKLEVTPEMTGILGQEVFLKCQFIKGQENSSITQIQWNFVSDKENSTILVFDSEHGMSIKESSLKKRVNLTGQSLKIIDVEMTDTGLYTCRITTFPSGPFHKTTKLVVVDGEFVSEQTKMSAGILSAIVISAALLLVILTGAVYLSFIKRNNTGRRNQVLIDTSSRVGSVTRPSYIIKDPEVVYADVRPKKPRKTTSSLNKNPQTAAMAEEVMYAEVKVYHQRPNLETVFSL